MTQTFREGTQDKHAVPGRGVEQGTRKDLRKGESDQLFAETAGILFTTLGQRQIGKSRMLPREAPGSFAVPCRAR